MLLINPGKEIAVYCFAFLPWMVAILFFLLLCVCRVIYRRSKKYRHPMAINSILFSVLCFAFSAISLWNIIRYVGMVWRWGQGVHLGEVGIVLMVLVPDMIMLAVSVIVCVRSYKRKGE